MAVWTTLRRAARELREYAETQKGTLQYHHARSWADSLDAEARIIEREWPLRQVTK